MGAPDILQHLAAVGVRLTRRGDKIIAAPREAVTPELVNLIRDHKPELLQSLTAQHAELTALVNRVADHHGFTAEQRQEALEIALADSAAALECFRILAAGISIPRP
jgi:hypothetical protein